MSKWIRQTHRWLAIAFTCAVVLNLAVQGHEQIALWVGLLTLIPLFLLMATGLWMFAQPHVIRWRNSRKEVETLGG
jgi:hypothetical protein